jgi:SHS2 domain-containing protein
MGYTFIDHTADVAADLTGRTLNELFASAAQALTDTLTELDRVRPVVTQSVTLEAGSVETLLVDWLNELVYRFEVQNMLFSDATVTVDSGQDRWALGATVAGELFDPARHPSRVLVKGATYHGLEIKEEAGEWRARVVLDI